MVRWIAALLCVGGCADPLEFRNPCDPHNGGCPPDAAAADAEPADGAPVDEGESAPDMGALDAAALDAAPAPRDAAPAFDTCQALCARLTDCAVDSPACGGVIGFDRAPFEAQCLQTCAADAAALDAARSRACEALLAEARALPALVRGCDIDTEALGGEDAPLSRITVLTPFAGADCVAGIPSAGAGVQALASMGSLDLDRIIDPLRPPLGSALMFEFADWPVGRTGNALGETTVTLNDGRVTVRARGLIGDELGRWRSWTAGALLRTEGAPLRFPWPFDAQRAPFWVSLTRAQITARLHVAEGVRLDEGRVVGFLRQAGFRQLIREIIEHCMGAQTEFCQLLAGIAGDGGADQAIALFEGLVPYEVVLPPAGPPTACAADTPCDALAVCLRLESTAIPREP